MGLKKLKKIITDNVDNRKMIGLEIDNFFKAYKETESEENKNFFIKIMEFLNNLNIDYDIKIFISFKLIYYQENILKDYKEELLEKIDILKKNDIDYQKSTACQELLNEYVIMSSIKNYEGSKIIVFYRDDIIDYLKEIGYDVSAINTKKYFLLVSFGKKGFNVKYYPEDKKISPLCCTDLKSFKNSLSTGDRLIEFGEVINGNISIGSKNVSFEELCDILKTKNRKEIKETILLKKLTDVELETILSLDIPIDIKHYICSDSNRYVEDFKSLEYIKHFDFEYHDFCIEVNNTSENIKKLESLGYTSIYSDFKRLYVEFGAFSFFNENDIEGLEKCNIFKAEDYKLDKILN